MARCVMAVVGVAPCQCFSPGGNQITSPGRISSIGPPQRWTRPQPAVTIRVWPSGWLCQAVRAPGSNVTLEPTARAGSGAWNRGSMRTAPVKYSAGALPEGCEPLLVISMYCIPPLYFFMLSAWCLSCSLTAGSSLEEKSSLPPKAASHDLYLVVIIDAPSPRVVE